MYWRAVLEQNLKPQGPLFWGSEAVLVRSLLCFSCLCCCFVFGFAFHLALDLALYDLCLLCVFALPLAFFCHPGAGGDGASQRPRQGNKESTEAEIRRPTQMLFGRNGLYFCCFSMLQTFFNCAIFLNCPRTLIPCVESYHTNVFSS